MQHKLHNPCDKRAASFTALWTFYCFPKTKLPEKYWKTNSDEEHQLIICCCCLLAAAGISMFVCLFVAVVVG